MYRAGAFFEGGRGDRLQSAQDDLPEREADGNIYLAVH